MIPLYSYSFCHDVLICILISYPLIGYCLTVFGTEAYDISVLCEFQLAQKCFQVHNYILFLLAFG